MMKLNIIASSQNTPLPSSRGEFFREDPHNSPLEGGQGGVLRYLCAGLKYPSSLALFIAMLFCATSASSCTPQEEGAMSKVPRVRKPPMEVQNAGFELGQAYWKSVASAMLGARVNSDSTIAHQGQRSLKIDLQNSQRLEDDAAFFLLTPWLALEQGGSYSFSVYARSDAPQAKILMRVFSATSPEGLSSGAQELKTLGREFTCTSAWQRYVLEGQLPVAEKSNYRFGLRFDAPAVYWIDEIAILRNGRPLTVRPEIEAALLPPVNAKNLFQPLGKVEALLRVVNHTQQQRRVRFVAKMKARVHDYAPMQEKSLVLAAEQSHIERVPFELPFGDVYDVAWELNDESGKPLHKDKIRLAARSQDLPPAREGTPVWGMHLNSNNLEAVLPTLRAAGIRHLRNVTSLHWEAVQPAPQKWQWPDEMIDHLYAQGFTVLGKLGFTPKWAVSPEKAKGWPIQNQMPASTNAFRAYIREVVSHYGDRMSCWEIWNEPNLTRYFAGTPAQYGELLATAIAEIKAVQPRAEVAGFSVAKFYKPETMDFFQQALTSQPDLRVAALSFHPYFNNTPEIAGLVQRIGQVSELFETQRGNNPVFWITEYGHQNTEVMNPTLAYQPALRPHLLDELTAASYLVRTACLAKLAGVKYFFCYAMDSERVNRSSDLFGLLEESWQGVPKPALLAYLALAQLLGDANYEEREHLQNPEIYLLHFRRADQRRVSVLWQATGSSQFALPAALQQAEAFDVFGNRSAAPRGGNVTLTGQPIFFLQR